MDNNSLISKYIKKVINKKDLPNLNGLFSKRGYRNSLIAIQNNYVSLFKEISNTIEILTNV